jgi:hypothetical protein
MKIANIVLVSATLALLGGCEKNAPDTANPGDTAGETPATDVPTEETPTEETPAEETPAEEAPAEEAPAE